MKCQDCKFYSTAIDNIPYCNLLETICGQSGCEQGKTKIKTNADKIRAMTDEKLSEFLSEGRTAPSCTGKCHKDYEIYGKLRTFCHDCWLDWLKQEARQ